MALSVTYTNFAGELVYENRGGTASQYVPDTLGSAAQLWSTSGVKTDEWTYWPFGEVRARTGTTNTPFTFIGILGYYLDILGSIIYVRARQLRQALARWQTLDPVWPTELAYAYAAGRPSDSVDPSGLQYCYGAGPWMLILPPLFLGCTCPPLFPGTAERVACCTTQYATCTQTVWGWFWGCNASAIAAYGAWVAFCFGVADPFAKAACFAAASRFLVIALAACAAALPVGLVCCYAEQIWCMNTWLIWSGCYGGLKPH